MTASPITPCWPDTLQAQNRERPIFVSALFARTVVVHLVVNSRGDVAPLILGIVGPFGAGKTVMLIEVLERLGVHMEELPASMFESEWAGQPAKQLYAAYLRAREVRSTNKRPAALVVQDLDLALGVFGRFDSATTNRQHTISALMEIADRPTCACGKLTERIPIFVTANDLTKLYGALTRPGRMRTFSWDPRGEERAAIVRHILRDVLVPEQVAGLLRRHPTWSIAHFAQFKAWLVDRALARELDGLSMVELQALLAGGGRPERDGAPRRGWMTQEELNDAACAMAQETAQQIDYTRPRERQVPA